MDGALNAVAGRVGSIEDAPGILSEASNLMFKLNGLRWQTDFFDAGHGLLLSHLLGKASALDHADIPPLLRETLSFYDIGKADWETIRRAVKTADGKSYITVDSVLALSDSPANRELTNTSLTYVINDDHRSVP